MSDEKLREALEQISLHLVGKAFPITPHGEAEGCVTLTDIQGEFRAALTSQPSEVEAGNPLLEGAKLIATGTVDHEAGTSTFKRVPPHGRDLAGEREPTMRERYGIDDDRDRIKELEDVLLFAYCLFSLGRATRNYTNRRHMPQLATADSTPSSPAESGLPSLTNPFCSCGHDLANHTKDGCSVKNCACAKFTLAQPGLAQKVQQILKRVDEDARGTRCLTMAEVTELIKCLRELAPQSVRQEGERYDKYASYANHCAIQKKIPMTWHSWKRKHSAAQPYTPGEEK
jgi:hypothetical protein